MILSDTLTPGQLTFIIRASILVLSYGGLFLLAILILSSAPRLASFRTHDLHNRIVGKTTSVTHSVRWLAKAAAGRNRDPALSNGLIISIFLLTIYPLLSAVADIGFLGFYACKVPRPPVMEAPGDIFDQAGAYAAINNSMVAGVDPASVRAFRCDSSEIITFNENITYGRCNSWRNGTFADKDLFSGVNTTDTDSLMMRLMRTGSSETSPLYLNAAHVGTGPKLMYNASIERGIAIIPDETGVRAVFGVPPLENDRRVVIEKTMVLEADMGCISLGIVTMKDNNAYTSQDLYAVQWNQRYWGPENLRPHLVKYGGMIRQAYRPKYQDKEENGWYIAANRSVTLTSSIAQIANVNFDAPAPNPSGNLSASAGTSMYGVQLDMNCTADVMESLGVLYNVPLQQGSSIRMCRLLGLTGTLDVALEMETASLMYCAVSQQVNMVSAVLQRDASGNLTAALTHLPSDIHLTHVDWYNIRKDSDGASMWLLTLPYLRYTLSDNPSGNAHHYVFPYTAQRKSIRASGPGSPGTAVSQLAAAILEGATDWAGDNNLRIIKTLEDKAYNFTGDFITRWAGQYGASYIQQSLSVNGWVAEQAPRLLVESTGEFGGQDAVCYKTPYAASFIPLLFIVILVTIWGILIVFGIGYGSIRNMESQLGGLEPLKTVCVKQGDASEVLMTWTREPETHLQALSGGQPIYIDSDPSAAGFIKSGSSTPSHEHGPFPSSGP